MASIGHIAVGMVAARSYHRSPNRSCGLLISMLAWSALSLLPDADVLGFHFGITYAAPWGHRGATHSVAFAVAMALLLAALAPVFDGNAARTFAFAMLVVTSHPLLDTLTDGGLACALAWPFDNHRYFAPWTPIPVAPLGRRLFSDVGLRVAVTELLLFSPLFVYAIWPRKPKPLGAR